MEAALNNSPNGREGDAVQPEVYRLIRTAPIVPRRAKRLHPSVPITSHDIIMLVGLEQSQVRRRRALSGSR
jgi:hypothetical protein